MWALFASLGHNFVPLLLLTFFSIVCYVCLHYWRNRDFYRKINKFDSFPTIPFFGSMYPVIFSSKNRIDLMLELVSKYDSTKPIVFWLSSIPILVVRTYEDIQVVSNKSHWRNSRGKFRKVAGDGIALSHPDKWRNIRRSINPAFGPVMLQHYLQVFNKQAEILCRRLHDVCQSRKVVNIFEYMEDMNVNTITENMAGIDLQLQENGECEFPRLLMKSLRLESSRFFKPWLYPDLFYHIYLVLSGQKDVYKKLHEMPSEVIATKFAEYQSEKKKSRIPNGPIADKPVKTFVDILVRLQDSIPEFTQQQVRDEVFTMIATGSESTAIVSSFTFLMLAMHQDVQKRLYEEITRTFGHDSARNEVQMEDLRGQRFEYLERCIKETLRKYSLAPIMLRESTEEFTLTNGQVVPVGTTILMPYYLIHHDANVWPNPEGWDPENFADDTVNSHFTPFGTGPRSCVGSKYAMISLKTQIIHVLRRFHLSTNIRLEDVEMDYDLVIRSKHGYPVTLTPRENNNK